MLRTVAHLFAVVCLTVVTSSAAEPDFRRDIAPLLTKRCLSCHHSGDASGELVLTTLESALEGGESGTAIEPGDAEASVLIERVVDGDMPPEERGESQALPVAEIELLRRWIDAGAAWPDDVVLDPFEYTNDARGGRDWWSLRPVTRPDVPSVEANDDVANPIDAFILARLEAAGARPAPLASPRVLVRRLFYDLIGLPPTAEQIEAFAADPSDAAWAKLVDGLLASPHYGERWGRRWLDVVRFAETCGYERDQEKPFAWRYRDWVVAAFNKDMPYDEFVVHQIAGDEVADRDIETVVGTGFLRLGTWNDEPNDPQDYKYERLEDLVHATSTAFLGLTVKCARCHDHKFDPIPQDDYYRMAAAFWAGPIEPRGSDLLGGPSTEELGFDEVLGWTDIRREPPPLHLLKAGDRHKPERIVSAEPMSFVPVLARLGDSIDAAPEERPNGSASTGRRLRLARWMVAQENPLVSRVWVNRLWQGHFGEGIVRSPDNFGFHGDPPTHPQLLDWLASEFRDNGHRSKHIHRLVLTSRTWRQSSLHPDREALIESDAGNRLWWHANRQRLDAEGLRDSLLSVSGDLDLAIGGPSFKPSIASEALEGLSRKDAAWQPSPADEQRRRSLYIYTKRGLLPPMMTSFDLTDTTLPCGRRDVTTVAPQALAMLNNAFTHERSRALADRVLMTSDGGQVTGTDVERIRTAWRLALGRAPSDNEQHFAQAHLVAQRDRYVALERTDVAETETQRVEDKLSVRDALVLHLRADSGVTLDASGQVATWQDLSPAKHDASQADSNQRPVLIAAAIGDQPALRFHGRGSFLRLNGKVLTSPECTVVAVATDLGAGGHREIISNWNGYEGNAGSSMFLGLTGDATVRFSDARAQAGEIAGGDHLFVLTAVNAENETAVYQNGCVLSRQTGGLPSRRLDTAWVIGQQGNINGEFWHGDIAEVIVFDRALAADELRDVWRYLHTRYDLAPVADVSPAMPHDPDYLALVSLCHVLLNSNEFLYVD